MAKKNFGCAEISTRFFHDFSKNKFFCQKKRFFFLCGIIRKKLGFFGKKKKKFLAKKTKHFLAKIMKKPAKFFMGTQMFSGDELDIRGLWEKKGQFFHNIIMIPGSKSEQIRMEFSDFFCFCRNFCTQSRKTTFVEKNFQTFCATLMKEYSLKV